jgi:hypothetical protein
VRRSSSLVARAEYDEIYAGVRLINTSSFSTLRSAETNRLCGYF